MAKYNFESFFDLSLDLLGIASTDGFFRRINPSFQRLLGWTSDELTREPFMNFIHPDDVATTLREVEKLALGIPTISFENRYRCSDGTYRNLLWTSFPEKETGLLYCCARDVTQMREGT